MRRGDRLAPAEIRLPQIRQKFRQLGSTGATLLMLSGCVEPRQHNTPPTTVSAAPATSEAQPPEAIEKNERGLIPFEKFRRPEPVPATLGRDAGNVTVRVSGDSATKSWSCTGAVINSYLITSGHCAPQEEGGGTLQVTAWQDGFTHRGELSKWNVLDPNNDLLIGKVDWKARPPVEWRLNAINHTVPERGRQFVAASLPGDTKQPVISNMTFLGESKNDDGSKRRWVFAVDPEVPDEAAQSVCMPGASGTLITDGRGYFAVLSSSVFKDADKDAFDWHEDRFGVDLSQVDAICLASPLTQEMYDLYTSGLN